MKKKSVLIFIAAKDFNESEYLIVRNKLIKSDFQIFLSSDSNSVCQSNAGLVVRADISLFNVHVKNFEAFIIIGGNGIKNYWNNTVLQKIVQEFNKYNKIIGAICNAPVILAKSGLLKNKSATCYSESILELKRAGANFNDSQVVVEKNIVTAKDPFSADIFIDTIINLMKVN